MYGKSSCTICDTLATSIIKNSNHFLRQNWKRDDLAKSLDPDKNLQYKASHQGILFWLNLF